MNQKLNFFHRIPIKVFHDTEDPVVVIKINNNTVFSQCFAKGTEHFCNVQFWHEYQDGEQNTLEFNFNGSLESANRYLIINSIEINNVYVGLYDAHYTPKINPQWWDSLLLSEKEYYLDIIYGKNGNTFGWFGNIKYYYYCGVNLKSRTNTDADKNEILLSRSAEWIFLESAPNTLFPGKLKKHGKLL